MYALGLEGGEVMCSDSCRYTFLSQTYLIFIYSFYPTMYAPSPMEGTGDDDGSIPLPAMPMEIRENKPKTLMAPFWEGTYKEHFPILRGGGRLDSPFWEGRPFSPF